MAKGNGMGGHESHAAETVVWLTPPEILEALGPFDLDPCAAPPPRPWPTARKHIALPEDGLALPWAGRVWLNPPYDEDVAVWLDKLRKHGTGTALVFARTETEWFHRLVWNDASAVFFFKRRLNFYRPDGQRSGNNAGAPSCLISYGQKDAEALRRSGMVGKFVLLYEGVFA